MSVPAPVKYLILAVLCLITAINLTRTTLNILESSKRLNTAKEEVTTLENKKATLLENINFKNTKEFLEERARDGLNMIKPGEDVYIAPKGLAQNIEADNVRGSFSQRGLREKKNWQLWAELFF